MAQDLSLVKFQFATGIGNIADRLLGVVRDCDEIVASYFAKGLNSAGANAFIQTDFTTTTAYLTPDIVASVITQLQAASAAISSGGRDVLRTALPGPLP